MKTPYVSAIRELHPRGWLTVSAGQRSSSPLRISSAFEIASETAHSAAGHGLLAVSFSSVFALPGLLLRSAVRKLITTRPVWRR